MHTLVLAEPGSTHEGQPDRMLRLLDIAAAIGCDGMKWQWLSSAEALCVRRHAPAYLASYRLIEGRPDLLRWLAHETRIRGLRMACTAYLPEDLAVVAEHVDAVKLASFDAEPLLEPALATGRPLLVSTGMADEMEFTGRARALQAPDRRHGLLVCTSAYPCPVDEVNLAVIRRARPSDGARIGLSDHTRHPWTGALAVGAGAEIIEFHLRLSDTDPANRDHGVARDPAEAAAYVAHVRLAERMCGDGIKRAQPSEAPMAAYRASGTGVARG